MAHGLRRTTSFLAAAASIAALTAGIEAQTPLTLRQALDEALAKNPDLAALRAQVRITRERPAQARALAPPVAEAQIWQWPLSSFNPADTNMYMFMVSQELPGRGKRRLREAVAEKEIALAEADVAIRARDVINQVKQAYAALFIARKSVDVNRDSIDLLRQMADVSQARYATGRISQQDVLKPVLELSRLHRDVITFEAEVRSAAARLNVLLDRPPGGPMGALVDPHEQQLLPESAELQRLAIERQPELQRGRLEIERSEAELAVARRDDKPDFTLQGGYMLMPRMTDAWMGRVGITWPNAPWSRRGIDARVAEHAAVVDAARARVRAMESAVRLAVEEAYVRVKAAQDRAALLRTTIVPQSRQTLDVSRIAYQGGRVDFQAVLDNQRVLLASQLDYYRALSDFEHAVADLERAIGIELPPASVAAVAEGK